MGMTQSEYAAHRAARGLAGGTRQAVSKAITEGRCPRLPDGTIDPVIADAAWATNTRARATSETPQLGLFGAQDRQVIEAQQQRELEAATESLPNAPGTLNEWRRRKEAANAQKAELELGLLRRRLVDADEVRPLWFKVARDLRTRLQAIPTRLAPQLAPMTDVAAIRLTLEREIDTVLRELADVPPGVEVADA